MAWVTKGDRFADPPGQVQTELTHAPLPASHSAAPYFSLAPRSVAEKGETIKELTPGPDAYNPPIPKKGHFDHGIPKRNAPFLSSGQRGGFVQETLSPGPGAYNVLKRDMEKFASRTFGEAQSERRQMLKSSSAPSIPQYHQSFGYEEAGGGRLIRQGARDGVRTMTGRAGDSAGPGQYAVNEACKKKKAQYGVFGGAPREVGGMYVETPGPGHYDARAPSGERPGIARQMPSFASASTRNGEKKHVKSEPDLPGPGQYSTTRTRKQDLRERHPELQFFGSTSERFKRSASSTAPGPGSYVGPPQRVAVAAQPFQSNSTRFHECPNAHIPGPGEYKVSGNEINPSGPLGTFSILGNSGGLAFGTMSRRFSPKDAQDAEPGPGDYALPSSMAPQDSGPPDSKPSGAGGRKELVPWKRPAIPSAAFHSQTPKDNMLKEIVREGQMKPPPGAYNPQHVKDTRPVLRVRGEGEGFCVAAARFGYDKKVDNMPGPASYSPPTDITSGKRSGTFNRSMLEGVPQRGRVKGLGFESHTKRFKDGSAMGPGPGEYNTDPNWISKSFNVYFGDVF
mmetsp:Transcript_6526/g.15966  ORF Transcript_6526/g.15966 Transcript_6526/m.15966 type:complete len:566 (-) Transcript_6526:73-1770(-)